MKNLDELLFQAMKVSKEKNKDKLISPTEFFDKCEENYKLLYGMSWEEQSKYDKFIDYTVDLYRKNENVIPFYFKHMQDFPLSDRELKALGLTIQSFGEERFLKTVEADIKRINK